MKLLRCLFLSLALSSPWASSANTLLTDLSDLWWNPNESGWGVTVTHQGNVAFLTFFIFGQDGKSTWYTGQAVYGGKNVQGAYQFSGPVYQVNGPWFGGTFVHAQVGARAVGTVDFTAFLNAATLHYTIDGTEVTKTVSRQTFRTFELTGEYLGAMKSTQSLCFSPAVSGDFNDPVEFTVAQTADTFFMRVVYGGNRGFCTFNGNYLQTGRFGNSTGTFMCTGGVTGSYEIAEIAANVQGFTGRYTSFDNFCQSTGRFAAMKK